MVGKGLIALRMARVSEDLACPVRWRSLMTADPLALMILSDNNSYLPQDERRWMFYEMRLFSQNILSRILSGGHSSGGHRKKLEPDGSESLLVSRLW